MSDVPFETVVDWAVEFMEIEGFPAFFEERVETLTIENHRALLPRDCSEVKAVRGFIRDDRGQMPISFRYATDTFMTSKNKRYYNDFTYKVQDSVIFTSMESGDIEIVYTAFKTDPNGFPLIPENSKFSRALEYYVKMKHYENLFEEGKLDPRVLERVEQQYCWAVGACESEFHKLSFDKAESLGNQWRQIIINTNEHLTGYANLGVKKDYKRV